MFGKFRGPYKDKQITFTELFKTGYLIPLKDTSERRSAFKEFSIRN